jgi:hypothetical protein
MIRRTVQLVAVLGMLTVTGFLFVWLRNEYLSVAALGAISQSHIDGNVPPDSIFDDLLRRDLLQYFHPLLGDRLTVDFELLRRGATQSGIAYPKFYLWVVVRRDGKPLNEGYARVAAVDRTGFTITDFIPRTAVADDSSILFAVFPAPVATAIMTRQRR